MGKRFEDQGDVVIDSKTGLMWQKGGSENEITYTTAKDYIKLLNHERFGGHSGWRLPTISELIALMELEKQPSFLYIDPIFDSTQEWCWSSDIRVTLSCNAAWIVALDCYDIFCSNNDNDGFAVRAVRSMQ